MKVKIREKKVVENGSGQKTTTGLITLSENLRMRNKANDGKYPWSKTWVEPTWVTVAKGTEVSYHGQETRTGYVYSVYATVNLGNGKTGNFVCRKIDKNHPCVSSYLNMNDSQTLYTDTGHFERPLV